MKIYAIHDKEKRKTIGYLFCYEKVNEYIIELEDELDEWDAPLLFQKFVREKQFTIPKEAARLWVEERVIPSGRQNIGAILKNAKLKEYNEMSLLALSKGKCSQDSCYLEEISYEEIPIKIRRRADYNVEECFMTDNQNIICLFKDNSIRKVSLKRLMVYSEKIAHLLKNEELLGSPKVGVGGYSVSFEYLVDIPVSVLRDERYEVPLEAGDFRSYARNNIVDTTKTCELMQCSRQNVSYMVNNDKLEPIIHGTKEKFFTRGSIERMMTE